MRLTDPSIGKRNPFPGPPVWLSETPLAALAVLLLFTAVAILFTRLLGRDGPIASGALSGLPAVGAVAVATVGAISVCRYAGLVLLAAVSSARRPTACWQPSGPTPLVSIFVPCYNESGTIASALESLVELDYPNYEILVVNDGSTDDTLEQTRRVAANHGSVIRVLDKPNGGKWSAHNLAFQHSTGELILCLDADSRLDRNALRRLVARMGDPRVAAVAGQMRVRNRVNPITFLQALEYMLANGAVRMAQGLFGSVLIVPGPIGFFRRSVLEEVWLRFTGRQEDGRPGRVDGPFEGDTFAEDFDLSLSILTLGGRIVYEPDAVSYTKAPERAFALVNQRYRWVRGAMQVLRKLFRRARREPELLTPRLVFWVVGTSLVDLALMPALHLLALAMAPLLLSNLQGLAAAAGVFAMLLAAHLTAAAFFVSLHRDRYRLLAGSPCYGPYCGFLLFSAWLISVWDELRGKRMRW